MLFVALIRYANQSAIKATLFGSTLVTSCQQNGLAVGIEGVGHTPSASIGIKTQFLHVGVARAFERICKRSSELRTILAEERCEGLQFFSNRLRQ